MKRHRFGLTIAIASIAAATSLAQYPIGAVGLAVSTNTGHNAGSFCWGFSCTPAALNITAGEVVTVQIRGEYQAAYFLGTSTTATSCVAYSGIYHSLILDFPVTIAASGSLSSASPILSCPSGYTTITATVPPGIPLGTTIAVQSLTYGAGNVAAFTGAVVLTII